MFPCVHLSTIFSRVLLFSHLTLLIIHSSSFHLFAQPPLTFQVFCTPLSPLLLHSFHLSHFSLHWSSLLHPSRSFSDLFSVLLNCHFIHLLLLFSLSWNLHHSVWLRVNLSTRVQGVSSIYAFEGEITNERYVTRLEGTTTLYFMTNKNIDRPWPDCPEWCPRSPPPSLPLSTPWHYILSLSLQISSSYLASRSSEDLYSSRAILT